MRLKEIKPGMVIHCKTEEEAKSFIKFLHEKGFKWNGGNNLLSNNHFLDFHEGTCYKVYEEEYLTVGSFGWFADRNETVTEFSDLIIPELSAKEVLEIMVEICDSYGECYNGCPLKINSGLHLCQNRHFQKESDRIVEICTKWREEHPKEEEKKVEVEQFWEIKCLEDPSYHTTEHYKDEAEALRMCVILAEKDPKNSYYAVFVAKAKE